ncbi:MAG: hypothetical protein IPH44_43340 [Myxococcales bacterium]|nr:hypothetical protein [Myxococcales bacterium]
MIVGELRNRRRATTSIRLTFASVGDPGEPYPDWVRALRDVSGVYAIREHDGRRPVLVYIGESHTDRLYQTLTRHWQTWRRVGIGRRESAHDPGVWYARSRCEAAVLVTPADRAQCLQDALIEYLSPRDNLVRATSLECPQLRLAVDAGPVVLDDDDTPF